MKKTSLAQIFFIHTTSKMITDLHDVEIDKGQGKTIQHLEDPPEYTSENSGWEIEKNSVIKNPKSITQVSENIEPSSFF